MCRIKGVPYTLKKPRVDVIIFEHIFLFLTNSSQRTSLCGGVIRNTLQYENNAKQ